MSLPRKRIYTTRDLFGGETPEEIRHLPVSEYAAKLIDAISTMRGIPPQQVLDEILAYWHVKGEIENELADFAEKFSQIEFGKLTPEAVQVLAMFLWVVEWFNKQQALSSLRLLNLTQMIQPITIYQQPPPAPTPVAPAPAPAPTTTPEVISAPPPSPPSLIPPELLSKLEEVLAEDYRKRVEKLVERLSGEETTDIKKVMMDEMMPMVKQMINILSTTLPAILTPKQQQQSETRAPSEEEKKILDQLD